MPAPLVSVVIPTFARVQPLRACLDALARQTVRPADVEVVVVDDGSPVPAEGLAAEFASRLRLLVVRQDNAGPAAARNRGVREAAGALVAFTDDDCLPRPDWLERLVAAEAGHPGALVGGTTVNGLPDNVYAATSQLIVDLVYEHFNADPDDAYFFTSNNMLCRRDRLLAIGGFDASYERAGAEDRDLCDRWRAAGLRLVWRTDAVIEHRHPQSLRKFVELHYRYGRGAHRYQHLRRARGTGTMREDVGFHGTLPRRVWNHLGRPRTPWQSLRIGAALAVWQVANAVGFAAEACASLGRRPA
jgi:GT2 family glycosyltransferase